MFCIYDVGLRRKVCFNTSANTFADVPPGKYELLCLPLLLYIGHLVKSYPEIDFVGAHMGGLAAPFGEIDKHLGPQNNLYLETSNAAHVLSRKEFLRLLDRHGPEHIIFEMDWPWFGHAEEIALIQGLLNEAGFSPQEQTLVFSGNISRLLQK